jgi:simple sugar transport system substrate-binding protein
VLAVAGCSGGGKQSTSAAANTPRLKIAMITHASAGDTFWDIIRKGAQAAAAKDNVDLIYSNNNQAGQQAVLIQNAIDQKVDGIATTLSNPDALAPEVKKAQDAGIPLDAFNAGVNDYKKLGVAQYFGQDENLAGQQAGARLATEGARHALCVIQTQGQVQLEARCAGVKQGLSGGTTENLNVNGPDMPSVRSTLTAKLQQDKNIDYVITLGAPIALAAVQSKTDASSSANIVTFDTNPQLVEAIQDGSVLWAIDQQPFLQGYLAVDALWWNITNGNTLGGGQTVLTGPSFIDKSNIDRVAKFAANGTR